MNLNARYGDLSVRLEKHVAVVEVHRPPHNYLDRELIRNLADALEDLGREPDCRAVVLASEGKSFCAGANLLESRDEDLPRRVYEQAIRLFAVEKPLIAAIQGAAIGAGLGMALAADFRVASAEARFAANFTKLGIHPGFALTYTLPRLVGVQRAALMLCTGRRVKPEEALSWGLVDALAPAEQLRAAAMKLAEEIADNAPLAVCSTRVTLRRGLVEAVKTQLEHERQEQVRLMRTEDFEEGVRAVSERRNGRFQGK